MGLSAPGLGSSLDVNSIISQLMAAESRPLTQLAKKEAGQQAKLTALGSLKSALSSFQTIIDDLSKLSKFQAMGVTTSDATILKATATTSAASGSYNINVSQMAQAHTLVASGRASTTATIGTGTATTVRIQFGTVTQSGDPEAPDASFEENSKIAGGTLTIDSTNNSLQGIRDAINKANLGVTATIVSDGSASPHRLVLTSNKSGEAGSMKITVEGEAAIGDLLSYDPAGTKKMQQTSAAQDALLTVNGVDIRSDKNDVTGAVQGVTLNVLKTGTSTINVTRDTAAITTSINAFIKAYNDLTKTLSDFTAYNPETRKGGVLIGDSTVRSIQTGMRNMLNKALDNPGGMRHLSDAGISFQKDGTLSVDSTKLQNAISNSPDEISALFATVGKTTDSLVDFKKASSATKPGQYDVFVTALATQGKVTGSAPAALSITQGVNDKFSVKINGVTASITLTAGNYTIDSLVAHLRSTINGNSAFSKAGIAVSVSADASGHLTVTSNSYGSTSKIEINGTGANDLLGAGRTSTAGTDIQGSIGGRPASGSGQELVGASGTDVDGLRLLIADGAENASRGTITFSYGYANQLSQLMSAFLGSDGLITSRTDGINRTLKDLNKQRESVSRRLGQVEQRYRAQFTALDTMISSMNQTSSFLTQQLNNLPNIK